MPPRDFKHNGILLFDSIFRNSWTFSIQRIPSRPTLSIYCIPKQCLLLSTTVWLANVAASLPSSHTNDEKQAHSILESWDSCRMFKLWQKKAVPLLSICWQFSPTSTSESNATIISSPLAKLDNKRNLLFHDESPFSGTKSVVHSTQRGDPSRGLIFGKWVPENREGEAFFSFYFFGEALFSFFCENDTPKMDHPPCTATLFVEPSNWSNPARFFSENETLR